MTSPSRPSRRRTEGPRAQTGRDLSRQRRFWKRSPTQDVVRGVKAGYTPKAGPVPYEDHRCIHTYSEL